MGRVAEANDLAPLQAYDDRGYMLFLSPLVGYWDDMIGRDSLVGNLGDMFVSIDRLRIANGWPTGSDGSPS